MISQDEEKSFYFANSSGLLKYDAEEWTLYPVPNKTIVRSVKAFKDRVYTGAYMEAGYWTENDFGKMEYHSLVSKFPNDINDGEQFWQIETLNDLVLFRSFNGIYIYNPETEVIRLLDNPYGEPISRIFKLNGTIYYQLVNTGLFKIVAGTSELVIPHEQLGETAIMFLFEKENQLAFVSGNSEFFKWDGNTLFKFYTEAEEQLNQIAIFDAELIDDQLVLATVGKGLVTIGSDGQISNNIDQKNLLLNNTVLEIFKDSENNIWAGLDYGIAMVDYDSEITAFKDIKGDIGSVYTALQTDLGLYVGTNQGLYLRRSNDQDFKLVPGRNGQVWSLDQIGGEVFMGHNNGTFLINAGTSEKICDRLGTWKVKKYSDSIYIQGHYNGISFLKRTGKVFECTEMLPEFPHSSKDLILSNDGTVWVSNEHKGVFHLEVDPKKSAYKIIDNYNFNGESGITSSLFKFDDTLYYSSQDHIYKYDQASNSFSKKNGLNELTEDYNRVSGKMIVTKPGELWGFSQDAIFKITPSGLGDKYQVQNLYIDQSYRNIARGYENISIAGDKLLLGVANGYLRFSDTSVEPNSNLASISIREVLSGGVNTEYNLVSLNTDPKFDYKQNNITFKFGIPSYQKYNLPLYSYRLNGFTEKWSDWSHQSIATFENLPFGEYKFEVKAKLDNQVTDGAFYTFRIQKPYYLSNLAVGIYIFIFLMILLTAHLLYRRHHKKAIAENERQLKMKNLEAEQEIIKLQKEKLEQDMASKNRELAVSTMSLIKKNEFLSSIKERLEKEQGSSEVKKVIKTIDKDIDEEDNWNFFKEAFNNADKDFLKKMKSLHPELTSSDLKLCAYLRLNLTSKEIAPLLNISVKSVEIKRYRLRKKMNLDRNENLTDYILSI
ncbi:hypothetical protein GRFL_1565 [Christiangramia flava JLT2011]|uniref:HTH luxR-type domain-containing protein n=2 Tax=Christiangramia TaxID=292691 RepID=A0A1L7I3U8_9FLAO|nr:hypothetical protein GRFL_1565 [Christiangramia flava JLT2011]